MQITELKRDKKATGLYDEPPLDLREQISQNNTELINYLPKYTENK